MRTLLVLLLWCHVASTVKHSLKYFLTASSGIPDFPEFVATAVIDEVQVGYCDSDIKTVEPKQDLVKKLLKDDPQLLEQNTEYCFKGQLSFRDLIDSLKEALNQTGGVHVLQSRFGCEWDEETEEVSSFYLYGYDGEDFITLDQKTQTWIAMKPEAEIIKLRWDTYKAEIKFGELYLTKILPEWLKMYIDYGKSSLLRTVLPSVSLLQKTPSSPVSCHATGFYSDRVDMFWRKDGEELHEDVDHGEILPNNDGTFQMSVDLDISSVKPEDWSRYDCVFQLSGVKEDVITKLDKAVIRTNWAPPLKFAVIGLVVVVLLLLLVVCISGLFIWRRRKKGFTAANTEDPGED